MAGNKWRNSHKNADVVEQHFASTGPDKYQCFDGGYCAKYGRDGTVAHVTLGSIVFCCCNPAHTRRSDRGCRGRDRLVGLGTWSATSDHIAPFALRLANGPQAAAANELWPGWLPVLPQANVGVGSQAGVPTTSMPCLTRGRSTSISGLAFQIWRITCASRPGPGGRAGAAGPGAGAGVAAAASGGATPSAPPTSSDWTVLPAPRCRRRARAPALRGTPPDWRASSRFAGLLPHHFLILGDLFFAQPRGRPRLAACFSVRLSAA
jgi:hypothetical protein